MWTRRRCSLRWRAANRPVESDSLARSNAALPATSRAASRVAVRGTMLALQLCARAHALLRSCSCNTCEAQKSVRRRTHNLRRRAAHHRARIRVLLAHRSPACSSACVRQSGAKARSRSPALRSEWFRGPLTALPRRARAPSHSAVRRPAPTRGPSSVRPRRTQAPSRTAAQRPAPPRGLFLAQAKRT